MKLFSLVFLFAAAGLSSPNATALAPNSDASSAAPAVSPGEAGAAQDTQSTPQPPPFPPNYKPASPVRYSSGSGSTYIPMDSWMYPALDRLSSMGYLDAAFFGLRPWTRLGVAHMLELTADKVNDGSNEEARNIFLALEKELGPDTLLGGLHAEVDSVYARGMGITGDPPLVNSFEFGQTITNDDGRPYGHGFNLITGVHARAEMGRFSLNVRGEYQHAPGYPALPGNVLAHIGRNTSQDTLTPAEVNGVGTRDSFRLIDANLSVHVLRHEISFGKSEMWWGPGQGGAFEWSTNAEPNYFLRINMVDPMRIPLLSRFLGPMRWDHYFGDLKGHVSPNQPWVFGDKISFHPTADLEIGFSRSCQFAGKGYSFLTFGSFSKCFFSTGDFAQAGLRRYDVGDRRGGFDFRWRLPYLQKYVTVYTDSNADDDPSPLANLYRSGFGPGIYISHLPGLDKWDLRFETPYTNQRTNTGINYTNHAYHDGFTNQGNLIGHWIGRDSTGYQGWLTYWLSPKEQVQFQYRDSKIDRALWASGGTQTDFAGKVVKRLTPDFELNGLFQFERYLIPVLNTSVQHNYTTSFQITYFPKISKQY